MDTLCDILRSMDELLARVNRYCGRKNRLIRTLRDEICRKADQEVRQLLPEDWGTLEELTDDD